jgi:hypothetical protein
VTVVTTGVHATGVTRLMRKFVTLLDRQRVQVSPQTDCPKAATAAHDGDDASLPDTRVALDAERLKVSRNQLGGAMLCKCQLWVCVYVATDCGQSGVILTYRLDDLHAFHLLCLGGHGILRADTPECNVPGGIRRIGSLAIR